MRVKFHIRCMYDSTAFFGRCVLSEINRMVIQFDMPGSPAKWIGQMKNPNFNEQTTKALIDYSKGVFDNIIPLPKRKFETQHYEADISDEYLLTHSDRAIRLYAAKIIKANDIITRELEGTNEDTPVG